jgi:hypothetical protein
MRKVLPFAAAVLAVAVFAGAGAFRADDKSSKYTTKEVMKLAHKEGLMKKVASGKGTKEEKEELLGLYIALSKNQPPKGDPDDWKKRCEAIVTAARDVVAAKEGAEQKLTKAVNCMGCHSLHRGKS